MSFNNAHIIKSMLRNAPFLRTESASLTALASGLFTNGIPMGYFSIGMLPWEISLVIIGLARLNFPVFSVAPTKYRFSDLAVLNLTKI